MKKKSFLLMVVFVCFGLLGLIAIQAYFLHESYKMKSELFDRSVNTALNNVVNKLEKVDATSRPDVNKEQSQFSIGQYSFDATTQQLSIQEKAIKLSAKESELLRLLCLHANDVLSREEALITIWKEDNYFNARSMDVYLSKLRKLLKDDMNLEIINVHGKGFKLIC